MIPTLYEPFRHWSEKDSVYILSDLRIDMVCESVPFFMSWKHVYGAMQSTYRWITIVVLKYKGEVQGIK